MYIGQIVKLNSALGKIERVVIEEIGDVLAVCRKEEKEKAEKEGRKPRTVGFRVMDVIKDQY